MLYGMCGRCHTNFARATTFCPFIIIGRTNFDLLVNHIFWPHQLCVCGDRWVPGRLHWSHAGGTPVLQKLYKNKNFGNHPPHAWVSYCYCLATWHIFFFLIPLFVLVWKTVIKCIVLALVNKMKKQWSKKRCTVRPLLFIYLMLTLWRDIWLMSRMLLPCHTQCSLSIPFLKVCVVLDITTSHGRHTCWQGWLISAAAGFNQ